LPFHSSDLNPDDDLWRLAKAQVAAHRLYEEDQSGTVLETLAE
jgi:hypothetical protein